MAVTITGLEPRSIAAKSGIKTGERLLKINGHDIADVLDYRFYMTEKSLSLLLESESGAVYEKCVTKREYDDLGLIFETYLMDSQRLCKNKCVFCFIDQMPKGMRDSLYFKDDDSRMSFLFGNYITLTNLQDGDIERIIKMRISPVNISVHTMNPALRVSMMKNPNAGAVLSYVKRLTDAGIKVNAQLVLCPELNDGAELAYSLNELSALAPNLQSVAVVPVGLTKFRDGLSALRLFTAKEAERVLDTIAEFAEVNLKNHGSRICFAADEFYLKADRPLPDYDAYEEFNQLENGVGLVTMLEHEFMLALEDEEPREVWRRVAAATGEAAKPLIQKLADAAMKKFSGLEVQVIAVENRFFGETITVAGLVTGTDLISTLKDKTPGNELLIPAVMLRHERDLFLDGISAEDVQNELGIKLRVVERDGYDLLDAMLGNPPG